MIDISWLTIFKISVSGIFLYLIMPFILIVRDLFLTWLIEKLILTDNLKSYILVSESARWQVKNKYSEELRIERGKHYIGDKEVSEDEWDKYNKSLFYYNDRANLFDQRIELRSNIIKYMMIHYKNNSFTNPITELKEEAHKHQETMSRSNYDCA